MRTAIAEALRGILDDHHLQVALEYWDLMYTRQEKHQVPHFLATVGQLLGISEADRSKAHTSVMKALSLSAPGSSPSA